MNRLQELTRRESIYSNRDKKLNNIHFYISLIRFILIVGILYTLFYIIKSPSIEEASIIGVLIVTFTILVKQHSKIERKRELYKSLISICQKEIKYNKGDLTELSKGNRLLDKQHDFVYDLDLFGEASLFQHLNRTISVNGEKLIKTKFENPHTDKKRIIDTQKNIQSLLKDFTYILKFLAYGSTLKNIVTKDEVKNFSEWIGSKKIIGTTYFKSVAYIFPICNISFIIVAETFNISYSFLSIIFIIQLWVYNKYLKDIALTQFILSNKNEKLSLLKDIFQLENRNFENTENLNNIFDINKRAYKSIRKIERIANSLDNRNNIFLSPILNWLFMWDFHCILKVEKWKIENASQFDIWIQNLAELDTLVSYSMYSHNNPHLQFPTVAKKDSHILKGSVLRHPLMKPENCVENDITISSDHMFIVTGPNMSGKSTFLRTVGLNMVMAKLGLPVSAKEFQFRPIEVFTSMRTVDSLSKNESYFFAELKKIKKLLHLLKTDKEYLVLLDELFKGTNSTDKLKGSELLCKELLKHKCSSMVATHDLPLTEIESTDPEKISNMCFEIEFIDDEMILDYKIRPGVTKVMNATYLINKMGLR